MKPTAIFHLLPALLACIPGVLHANLIYVDATDGAGGNTTLADGSVLLADDSSGATTWRQRDNATFGSHGTIFEGVAPAPTIKTTLSGLTPGQAYVVYVHFVDKANNTEKWNIRAGFSAGGLKLFADASDAVSGATAAVAASTLAYTTAPTLFTGTGVQLAGLVGTIPADANGRIAVFVDDYPSTDVNLRAWYDGISYRPAPALDPSADQDGDGLNNGDELSRGTNPYLADTDGDGHSDGAEVTAGSNPLDPESVPPLPGNALEITSDGAWTWFNDERAIFHQGSLIAGYVKGNGQYGVTRYDPAANQSYDMILSTSTSQQRDDHNNPSITVLPDGRLMVLYAKHVSEPRFYQRTSLVPLPSSNADWGPEVVRQLPLYNGTSYNNTYNNTYLLTAESNRIYNFHRHINFNPTITISDDLGATWRTPIPFIAVGSGSVRPYPRYCSNGSDRIDLIYTDGHPRDVNNSVYHMYYRAGRFHKTDGTLIDTIANLPLDHQGGERGPAIYQYSAAAWGPGQGPDDWIPGGRGWTWDVQYGRDGHPVCVFQVQVDNVTGSGWNHDRIYYYYARWTGTAWQKRFIAQAGRGIYSSEDDYGGGMCIDPANPNVIYISSNAANPFQLGDITNVPLGTGERYEIHRGETSDGGLTFSWRPVTANSAQDNLRPIIPAGSPFDETLIWFNGTYTTYTSFNTRVLGIFRNNLRLKNSSLSPAARGGTMTWASSPGLRYRITGSADLQLFPHLAKSAINSQGSETSSAFSFPLALQGAPRAFFRVENE